MITRDTSADVPSTWKMVGVPVSLRMIIERLALSVARRVMVKLG